MLAEKDPTAALPPSREKPMTPSRNQLQINVDQPTMTALQDKKRKSL